MQLNVYTRKIDREHNDILLTNTDFWQNADGTMNTKIDAKQIGKANDYLVMAMTGMTQEALDQLEINEYNRILAEINAIRKEDEEKKKK